MREQSSGKTIAKNTIFLYARLLITVLVSLYTARVVLQALGVNDFGLYNVVGGLVAMLGFLNAGMVQASQRFLSYEIGKEDAKRLKDVFSTTLLIHILIAIVIFVAIEVIGVWFLNTKMNVLPDRMVAANWVLQCTLLSFLFGVITVPYNAVIIAHEKMGFYAVMSIIDAILKLGIVFLVVPYGGDKLILYSLLLLTIPAAEFFFYSLYCNRTFKESSYKPVYNKELFRKVLSFAGWSFVGNIGFAFRNNGVNIVINLFCGTAINAARGIAYQVSSQIVGFTSNFQMAIIPQITKRYAANDNQSMISLVIRGSKYSFILLYLIALPFCLRADYVLQLWLGEVPQYTLEFVSLILIVSLIDGMAIPIGKAIDATGDIKWFQITIAVLMLLDIPFAYVLLSLGVLPYVVVVSSIFVSLLGLFARIIIVKRRFDIFPVLNYLTSVFLRCILIAFVTYFICYYLDKLVANNFIGLIVVCIMSVFISSFFFFFFGLDKLEKESVKNIILTRFHKYKK